MTLSPPPSKAPTFNHVWTNWLWLLFKRVLAFTPNFGKSITSTDSPYTAQDIHYIFADATAGNITVNLPIAGDLHRQYVVKKTDSSVNTVTLDADTVNIDGATTYVISTQYLAITAYWDGSQYWIV